MNLKKNLRKKCALSGLIFGPAVAAFILLPRILLPGQYVWTLAKILLYFVGITVFMGPLYGLMMYWIFRGQQKKFLKRFPILEQKTILLNQNGFRVTDAYPDGVSGGCFLTDTALYFAPEIKKFSDASFELPLQQIQKIRKDTLHDREWLLLYLSDESIIYLRFEYNNTRWAMEIKDAIEKLPIA